MRRLSGFCCLLAVLRAVVSEVLGVTAPLDLIESAGLSDASIGFTMSSGPRSVFLAVRVERSNPGRLALFASFFVR